MLFIVFYIQLGSALYLMSEYTCDSNIIFIKESSRLGILGFC